jgi:hypothetical protein
MGLAGGVVEMVMGVLVPPPGAATVRVPAVSLYVRVIFAPAVSSAATRSSVASAKSVMFAAICV